MDHSQAECRTFIYVRRKEHDSFYFFTFNLHFHRVLLYLVICCATALGISLDHDKPFPRLR